MSYDLKLFRKEIRVQYSDLSFLENEEIVEAFTDEQVEILKKRLRHNGYIVENESPSSTTFNFQDGKLGITAYLTKTSLTFQCAGGSQEGLFEIMQTSDELSDSEFLTLNLQNGSWSGMCLEDELEAEKQEKDLSNPSAEKPTYNSTETTNNLIDRLVDYPALQAILKDDKSAIEEPTKERRILKLNFALRFIRLLISPFH